MALWTVAADNPTLCELVLLHKGPIVESGGPGEGTGSRLGDREVWVRGAWVWGLEPQWLAHSRGMYWCSADTAPGQGVRTRVKGVPCCFPWLQCKTYTVLSHNLLHISTQFFLRGEQLYENRFLIRAVVSLIYFPWRRESDALIIKTGGLSCLYNCSQNLKYFAVYPLLTPAQRQAHMCGAL